MDAQANSIHSVISKGRLEFLFDGIFAIAMTLLVLELKVPEIAHRNSVSELAQALTHDAPGFMSYLISFVVLGIFWYRHNWAYRHFTRISKRLLALHFVQLAMAAFFPFTAALMGRYSINPVALAIYVGCCMVYLWCTFSIWVGARRDGVMSADLSSADYQAYRRSSLGGSILLSLLFILMLARVLAA